MPAKRPQAIRTWEKLLPSDEPGQELEGARLLPLNLIDHTPYFRRDSTDVKELAQSLEERGQLQPIRVRPIGERYQVVAGNRRLEAAQSLGWSDIAVTIKEADDQQAAIDTAIENFQRAELTLAEEARLYNFLIDILELPKHGAASALAETLSRDNNRISRLLNIAAYPDLLERASAGSIGFMDAYNQARDRSKPPAQEAPISHGEKLPQTTEVSSYERSAPSFRYRAITQAEKPLLGVQVDKIPLAECDAWDRQLAEVETHVANLRQAIRNRKEANGE